VTVDASDPTPPGGPVWGYGTNGFADHPLESALDVLEGTGYGAVALTLGHPHLDPFADDWREQTALLGDSLRRRGLRVVIETGARYLLDPFVKHRPTLVDAECGARLEFLGRAIQIADLLGADAVSLWSGVLPADTTAEDGWARLIERMRGVVERATHAGVRLALEPEPGMLVETVADALRLREELGSPDALGITIDLGHCVVVEPHGVDGALRAAGELLLNVQVDDMRSERHEHLELGTGELDLPLALRTLAEIGYTGIAAVELPRHSHDAPRLAAASLEAIRAASPTAASAVNAASPFPRLSRSSPDSPPDASGTTPPHAWTLTAGESVRSDPARIDALFAAAGREVGRDPLAGDADPLGLVHGTEDDRARAHLIAVLAASAEPATLAETLDRLYRYGDDAERRGVLVGLNGLFAAGLPDDRLSEAATTAGLELVRDALRANDPRLVAAAMGPFGAAHLDAHAWRHGVLKLVFMEVPLAVAARLDERRDAELERMADGFARERRAASRPVSDDVLALLPRDRVTADADR